ncbi:MAG: transglutaminase domain-containing protein [Candidatus Latescibacteria bacterium]|nr:transglutaminase domain-containing protein [Candidatus Latescibacterota bacterium]
MRLKMLLCFICLAVSGSYGTAADSIVNTTGIDAITAYEDGFAYDVMRATDKSGIILDNMVLIEDDGPGSGVSEKGTYIEEIHQGILAKKTFDLEDPKAFEAHIILYMIPKNSDKSKQQPFYIILNGERIEGPPLSWHENMWHWVKVPVKLLKKGDNTLVLGCNAPTGEGYDLFIARADEYEAGGGMYTTDGSSALFSAGQIEVEVDEKSGRTRFISIGKNSSKSKDGGKNWSRMNLGKTDDVIGEYTIRLNLKRYKSEGSLLSPPIDLWDGINGLEKIKPFCTVSNLKLFALGDTPDNTSIIWQIRRSNTPDMTSETWEQFATFGEGQNIGVSLETHGKRYIQWKAVLRTKDSLITPVVHEVKIMRTLTYTPPPVNTFFILNYDNIKHRYSSVKFSYEKWNEPQLKTLRKRLKLDEVNKGATTDFEIINRVRHLVSQQWHHGSPLPDYPEWNALDILDRRDRTGKGGMCIQFSVVFIQSLASLGYQARHINMFAHETVEIYVDELGKWVHVDPESVFDSYEYETTTGLPINCLEQHKYFLRESGLSADNPVNWQAVDPWTIWGNPGKIAGVPVPLDFSTFTGWINDPNNKNYPPQHILAGFMRMMPRNDYFSRPYPRPLSQGSSNWPWNGYLNWYDEATPRKLQYALHTDREIDFYPTLNRVEFSAVYTENKGEIAVDMITFAPNFDGYEINIDYTGWQPSGESFVWVLKPSALNTLEMRVKNKLGPKGKPSCIQVMYHYKEPFLPRPSDW